MTYGGTMPPFMASMFGAASQGILWGIMALGVYITFKILDFADMTVDGSFPLGACVLAACLVGGIPIPLALLISFAAGMMAGLVTTIIYTKLRIPDLLAGILTMTMLYSINLRIMSNKANISFLRIPTLFSAITDIMYDIIPDIDPNWGIVAFLLLFVFALKSLFI